jgi:class 3 adenylate cyclase
VSDLPAGTVTFLFTDVEGSTKLLGTLGATYRDVMHEHRRLLTEGVEGAGGIVYGFFGDAVSAVFGTAADAVEAATTSQRAFAAASWPESAEIRIRIGIHTGDAIVESDEYLGLDVHRTARICAAAHGGQVLLSESAYGSLGASPRGVAFRDLGAHQLKGLPEPDQLFQLQITGLRNDFPPLRVAAEPPATDSSGGSPRRLVSSLQHAVKALPRRRRPLPESPEEVKPNESSLGVSAVEFSFEVSPAGRRRGYRAGR